MKKNSCAKATAALNFILTVFIYATKNYSYIKMQIFPITIYLSEGKLVTLQIINIFQVQRASASDYSNSISLVSD